jgi:hypothetical protein
MNGKWLLPKEELTKTLLDRAIHFFKGLFDVFNDSINQQYRFKDLYEYEECLDIKTRYFGK